MKLLLLIFILLILNAKKLDMVVEISRHGARSPIFDYYDGMKWKMVPNSLTQIGMRQHYLIGREIRKKYIENEKLLSPVFNSTEIYIFCKTATRTIMSAQSQMLGLFYESGQQLNRNWKFQAKTDLPPFDIDPEEAEKIIEDLRFKNLPFSYQPIPEYTFPEAFQDAILEAPHSCPRVQYLIEENTQTQIYQDFVKVLEEHDIFERFRKAFKLSDDTYLDIVVLGRYFDTVLCDLFQQRPLPEGFDEELFNWVNFLYDFRMLYEENGSDLNIKLQTTKLFKDMINQIQKPESEKYKFLYYSASDGNVNLLNLVMNVVSVATQFEDWKQNTKHRENAQFASTIFLEIYKDEAGERTVRYIFNGEVQQNFGNCHTEFCPLDSFISSLQNWILEDAVYDYECNNIPDQQPQHSLLGISSIFNFLDWDD